MHRIISVLFFVFPLYASVHGQHLKQRYGLWYIPSIHRISAIHGIAIGPAIDIFDCCYEGEKQTINGLTVEIIGKGLIPWVLYYNSEFYDIYRDDPKRVHYRLNGISLSPGGICQLGTVVNGISFSGLSMYVSQVNGLSMCGLLGHTQRANGVILGTFLNTADKLNGVAIGVLNGASRLRGWQAGVYNDAGMANGVQTGAFNHADTLSGVQIGLWNRCDSLRGVQIGLWNRCGKRQRPFLMVRRGRRDELGGY